MTYAIIRGNNGRRHEVDFGDSPVRVEVYASEETVEIFVEADSETLATSFGGAWGQKIKQGFEVFSRGNFATSRCLLNGKVFEFSHQHPW